MQTIDCPILLSEDWKLGRYSNAFRVQSADTEDHCILEFLVYSARENQASVVARVKVSRAFLPTVRDRMNEILEDLSEFQKRDFLQTVNKRGWEK